MDSDEKVPKLLCQIDSHLSCVNCVKWSSNGELLATGSDDKLVMIWRRSATKSGSFGSGGIQQNYENWRCLHTLRGHSGDVLDLAWSPQDRWLATSSVDNSIIIWDALSFPNMTSILKGHTGLVKGVTWDPVGKFLASQSDDRTVRIWKTLDWSCQTTITDPFEECGGTTHVLRLSWSPDGQYLVSAHAMNNGVPTAQIIERDGWKCDKDFVGHRKAITCARFNSAILKRETPQTTKTQRYCCLAMGSRDRSLSIWCTNMQRPTVVLDDVFQDSVLDIAWSQNGCLLMACSSDGTVACLQFNGDELGKPLSLEEKNLLYQRIYGKDISLDLVSQANKDIILENSEMLQNTTKESLAPSFTLQKTEVSTSNPPTITSTSVTHSQSHKQINKQIETRTADGKRRITPRFIPVTDEPVDISDKTSNNKITSQQLKSFPDPAILTNSNSLSTDSTFSTSNQMKLDSRIKKISAPAKTINIDSKYHIPESIINSTSKQNGLPPKASAMVRVDTNNIKPLQGTVQKIAGNFRITVTNASILTQIGHLTKLVCNTVTPVGNKKLWELYIESPVTTFSCCIRYILTCSMDGSVRFVDTQSGILLLPVLTQSSPIALCTISSNYSIAAILTKNCDLRIWNMDHKRIFHSTNCSDVIAKGTANALYINDQGAPFITLTDGSSYSYSKDLESWLKLCSTDLMTKTLLSKHLGNNFVRNMKQCPLTTVQSLGKGYNVKSHAFDLISEDWPHTIELMFLENQIKICETLVSNDEIKFWYGALGTKLASHGTDQHIRKLLDDLLTSFMCEMNGNEDSKEINETSKNSKLYLEILLDRLKREPKWQRLYMEYYEQIS